MNHKEKSVPFEQATYLAQVRRLRGLAFTALKSFPIKVVSCDFINHGENATFKVTAKNGEKYLLRIHRADYHSKPALLEELRWLEILTRYSLHVPRPIRSRHGKKLVEVSHPGIGRRSCDLLRWTEGRFISKSISEADMFKIGALLADIQSIGRKSSSKHRNYWTSDGLIGTKPKFGSIDRLSTLKKEQQRKVTTTRKALLKKLRRYEKTFPHKMGLIHADLHFGNLLKTNSGEIAAIDFDDCGYGFYIYDLAIPLVSIYYHLHEQKRFHSYPSLKKSLLEGYSSRAELTDHDLDLLQDLIIVRKLLMIGWLHSRSDNPRLKSRLTKFVSQTLKYIAKPNL